MKSILFTTLITTVISTNAHAENISTKNESIDQSSQVVATFKQRPGNPSITPDGRLLVSLHPLDQPNTKVVEVSIGDLKSPYPSKHFSEGENSLLKAVIAIRTDDQGVAWMLDLATHKVYGWDTRKNTLVNTIQIPEKVLRPKSFLQDFALDQKRNRIIIADMTQSDLKSKPEPAFITVDLNTGKAVRVAENHPSMLPDSSGGFALNPITIDPNYEWVYFGALNGHEIYRVKASYFDNNGEDVADNIHRYAPKPYSDGITVDSQQNVYIADIEHNAIGVSNPKEYKVITYLGKNQTW